jgi:dTDP-glucose 4,6-dehydratase
MDEVRVLVTGSAGFIGSHFVRLALHAYPHWLIVGLDKLTYAGNRENLRDLALHPRYRFVQGDIANAALVDELFDRERFTAVANFAAESHVDRSILDPVPFMETNVRGTQVLLEAARRHGVGRFLQVSTDEVYGSRETGAWTEDAPLRPASPYAASKAAADLLCEAYATTYGLPVVITRCCNNYGSYQFPEKLIPLVILRALRGEPVPVYGRGENVRDWLYVEDHCRAVALILERGRPGTIYNIGAGQERRNLDLVQMVLDLLAEALGRPADALRRLVTFVPDRPGHDRRYALNWDRIRTELGWAPSTTLEEGLRHTLRWYLEHRDWLDGALTGSYHEYTDRVYGRSWR